MNPRDCQLHRRLLMVLSGIGKLREQMDRQERMNELIAENARLQEEQLAEVARLAAMQAETARILAKTARLEAEKEAIEAIKRRQRENANQ